MRYLLAFMMSMLTFGVQAQNYNIEMLSNVRFEEDCANIWGYSDTSGREYAIIGRISGTSIFDVTDGKKPKLLVHIPGARSLWREIKSWKDRIYCIADQGRDGLLIMNMAKAPDTITWKFWKPFIIAENKELNKVIADSLNRSHDLFIDEKGYCFLTGGNLHSGTVILDLKEPDLPSFVGIFNPNYTHDSYARNDTFWSADILAGEFTVWNLKNKSAPKKLASQRTGNAFTHNVWLSDDKKYLFTTDERANAFVESYDVSDLNNITFLDRYRHKTTDIRGVIPHNTYYHKGFLVTSYYTDGFNIVDASNPAHLVEVASFDTYPAGDGEFHGCWGVYPYLPSGNILASDIEFGLYVVKPNYKKASFLTGSIKNANTLAGLDNVKIKMEISPFTEILSDNTGNYKTGGPFEGELTLTFRKEGFLTKTIKTQFKAGQNNIENILLEPLQVTQINISVVDAKTKQGISQSAIKWIGEHSSFITTVNADGQVTNGLFTGSYQLQVAAWGYKFTEIKNIILSQSQSIIIELQPGYEDNFVFNLGWTASSTARGGLWVIQEPRGAYIKEKLINPEYDADNDIGDQCALTGNNSSAITAADVDAGFTRLVSPEVSLTGIKRPFINFQGWTAKFNTVDSIQATGSQKLFLVSGSDTILIDSLKPNSLAWQKYSWPIPRSKLKDSTATVRIVFEASEPINADSRNILELAIDAFSITEGGISVKTNDKKLNFLKLNSYPNPFEDRIHFSFSPANTNGYLEIMDINGRKIYSELIKRQASSLDINLSLPSGIYFARIAFESQRSETLKLIKIR